MPDIPKPDLEKGPRADKASATDEITIVLRGPDGEIKQETKP